MNLFRLWSAARTNTWSTGRTSRTTASATSSGPSSWTSTTLTFSSCREESPKSSTWSRQRYSRVETCPNHRDGSRESMPKPAGQCMHAILRLTSAYPKLDHFMNGFFRLFFGALSLVGCCKTLYVVIRVGPCSYNALSMCILWSKLTE